MINRESHKGGETTIEEKKRVLVVDDEDDVVQMIKMALETAGYEVIIGYNGAEVVVKAKDQRPGAIVLDLMMPVKNGFEACIEIKNNPDTSNIPILVLAAIGEQLTNTNYARNLVLRLESDDYIEKPVDLGVLLNRLAEALGWIFTNQIKICAALHLLLWMAALPGKKALGP